MRVGEQGSRSGPLSSTLDTRPSTRCAILVYEREPYWAPELQRQFLATGVKVRGCHNWADLFQHARTFTSPIFVVELQGRESEFLAGLQSLQRESQSIPLIVLATAHHTEWEWVLRDAGVRAFFSDHLTGEDLAQCCRRWFRP